MAARVQLVWESTQRFCSIFTRKKKECAMKEEPKTSEVNKHNDESAIKRVIEGFVEAFRARDLEWGDVRV